jgi:hypothetical protein
MIIFCFGIHHLWGHTTQTYAHARAISAYADDGYINAPLSVAFRILADHKRFLADHFHEERWPRAQHAQNQDPFKRRLYG